MPRMGTRPEFVHRAAHRLEAPAEPEPAEWTKRPAKVLHLISGEHYAGAERVQDLLALGLLSMGFEVGFACLKRGAFARQRASRSAELFDVAMATRFDFRVVRRLAELVHEQGFLIIHTHCPRAALIGRLVSLASGVPMVHHVHGPTHRDTESTARNWRNAAVERLSLLGVDHLLPVSRHLAGLLRRQGVAGSRITVVQNGVPALPSPPVRRPPGPGWTFGMVALLRPKKGLETLLEALAQMHRRKLPFVMRIVGAFESAAYERRMRALAAQLGIAECVQWAGFSSDVAGELSRIDVLVLPSLYGEGMPMVLLEAMAGGVPVVMSALDGMQEAVQDGVTGLLVEPGRAPALADALTRFIAGNVDWQAMSNAATLRHRDGFSDRLMCSAVAAVYRRLLQN
jgi:glycosyltransferase involved in cell wall biosynthesis